MSKRTVKQFLADIQEAARRIKSYTSEMSHETFQKDTKTQDAVIRNLEIIGEGTKNLPTELRARYPDVPWKSMAGVRDRLIHDYFAVDLEIVWNIAILEIPAVALQIEKIMRNEYGHVSNDGD